MPIDERAMGCADKFTYAFASPSAPSASGGEEDGGITMEYIFEIAFAVVSFIFSLSYKKMSAKIQQLRNHNEFLSLGVQALLREQIVNDFNKYTERGTCPIYAKESMDKLYKAYHALGGNGTITELYEKLMEMEEK